LRTARLERTGQVTQNPREGSGLHHTPDLFAQFFALDDAGIPQDRQVARYDGQVDAGTVGDGADGASLTGLRQTDEQRESSRVG